jgi:hypothetical protein
LKWRKNEKKRIEEGKEENEKKKEGRQNRIWNIKE